MGQSAAVEIDPGAAFFEGLLYDPLEVDLRLTDMGHGCVFIDRIECRVQGKGLGTRTMRMLTDLTDRLGVQLILVAAPLCDERMQDDDSDLRSDLLSILKSTVGDAKITVVPEGRMW